jgi:large subunit ribosomal protein L15
MQLHQLKSIHKPKKAKYLGRGGKKGFTSGKGSKGQSSRAGRKYQPLIRQLIKRYPKLKGHRARAIFPKPMILNLAEVDKKFEAGQIVSPKAFRVPALKILGQGELTKNLTFENCSFSRSAREKIEKAGGTIK